MLQSRGSTAPYTDMLDFQGEIVYTLPLKGVVKDLVAPRRRYKAVENVSYQMLNIIWWE